MTTSADHLAAVQRYYDETNELYLRHVGRSYQAGVLRRVEAGADPLRETNLFCAARAGIANGQRILDAGCGSCGPSIDIANAFPDVTIESLTLSPVQAESARQFVEQANLSHRITVRVADYHALPFDDDSFDVAIYMESTAHSPNPHQMFREALRVLRPGGCMYIKDMFSREELSADDRDALAELNRVYALNTRRLAEEVTLAKDAGFERVDGSDLSEDMGIARFVAARYDWVSIFPVLNDFGRYHTYARPVAPLPAFFGDIRASKANPSGARRTTVPPQNARTV
ncbi:MAG: cyclopropane-fatty-acyl-phospholipid synthase family protein [Vicinamibacterales bacterium]